MDARSRLPKIKIRSGRNVILATVFDVPDCHLSQLLETVLDSRTDVAQSAGPKVQNLSKLDLKSRVLIAGVWAQ